MKTKIFFYTIYLFTFYLLFSSLFFPFFANSAEKNIDDEILFGMHSIYPADEQLNPSIEYYKKQEKKVVSVDSTPLALPDATIIYLNALRNWDKLRTDTKQKIARYVGDRDTQTFVYPSDSCSAYLSGKTSAYTTTHFTISYTKDAASGQAVSTTDIAPQNDVPDYIESIGNIAENVWNYEITSLGFQAPLLTSEVTKYEIFVCDIFNLNSRKLGQTVSKEAYLNCSPTDPNKSCSAESYMELDNDYSGATLNHGITLENLIQVTLAHEFFHAIQFYLNWEWPSYWLLESTATWVEDEVYPDINDYVYQYLSGSNGWFAKPETSIDYFSKSDILPYGSSIFFRHISENIAAPTSIKGIWDLVRYDTMGDYEAGNEITEIDPRSPHIQTYLTSIGKNFNDVFKSFAAANYLKQYRDGKLSYFPNIKTYNTSTLNYPINKDSVVSKYPGAGTLNHSASRYFVFYPPSIYNDSQPPYRAALSFSGSPYADWGTQVLAEKQDGAFDKFDINITNSASSTTIDDFGTTYKKFVLIISNLSTSSAQDGGLFDFGFSIEPQQGTVLPKGICGDIDGDEQILSNDVLMSARASIGMITLTSDQMTRADVNLKVNGAYDGNIFSNDLLITARASIGLINPSALTCEANP